MQDCFIGQYTTDSDIDIGGLYMYVLRLYHIHVEVPYISRVLADNTVLHWPIILNGQHEKIYRSVPRLRGWYRAVLALLRTIQEWNMSQYCDVIGPLHRCLWANRTVSGAVEEWYERPIHGRVMGLYISDMEGNDQYPRASIYIPSSTDHYLSITSHTDHYISIPSSTDHYTIPSCTITIPLRADHYLPIPPCTDQYPPKPSCIGQYLSYHW